MKAVPASLSSSDTDSVYMFAQDDVAAFAPFVAAAAGDQLQLNAITPSAPAAASDSSEEADWTTSAIAPAIDRTYEYGRHFKLDEPFTIRLRKGETLLLPLEPIHDLLFPSSIGLGESTASPLAIGLELSNCQGTVQSFIQLKSHDHAHQFSTASYQCMTVTQANEQQRVNLCPHYDPAFPVAMRMDPAQVKGFILRADIDEAVESIALLRSTKSSGGFEKSFLAADSDDTKPAQSPFNVSFSYEATTLGFESPSIWESPASFSGISSSVSNRVEPDEYDDNLVLQLRYFDEDLLATGASVLRPPARECPVPAAQAHPVYERLNDNQHEDSPPRETGRRICRPLPVQWRVPVRAHGVSAEFIESPPRCDARVRAAAPLRHRHHELKLTLFLSNSLPTAHFFIAFVAVALFAIAAIIQVQYQPYRRFFPKLKPSASDAEDEAEFVSLLACTAKSTGSSSSPREDTMDSLEEGLLDDQEDDKELTEGGVRERSSLLEAIKRMKK